MQLIDGVCQKHRPLVFLAGLLLVKEYATYAHEASLTTQTFMIDK
jgi:hypothetical protein